MDVQGSVPVVQPLPRGGNSSMLSINDQWPGPPCNPLTVITQGQCGFSCYSCCSALVVQLDAVLHPICAVCSWKIPATLFSYLRSQDLGVLQSCRDLIRQRSWKPIRIANFSKKVFARQGMFLSPSLIQSQQRWQRFEDSRELSFKSWQLRIALIMNTLQKRPASPRV